MENPESFEIEEDLRQSVEYGRYMEGIGWKTVKILNSKFEAPNKHQVQNNKFQIFLRRLGPVCIAKLQRTKGEFPMEKIEIILKEYRVMMAKLEPEGGRLEEYKKYKYRLSGWPLLGTKTLRVNLRPAEEEIFKSFKKDARYELRKIESRKWTIEKDYFNKFYGIWKMSAKRKNLWVPGEKEYKNLVTSFGKNVFCLTIEDLAGALVLVHKKTAFYYYAGSTREGMKLDLPYLIVWEAMKEAKKRGCILWDFEGIYDGRWPNKDWQGFSHFKKSFGGKEIEFPGSFEKWRWPL